MSRTGRQAPRAKRDLTPFLSLYGSGYPHNIGDIRGCLTRVDALPFEQRKAARGANAMRIFKI